VAGDAVAVTAQRRIERIEMEEETVWAMVVCAVAAVIITALIAVNSYYRAVDASAIAKGLCQTTVAGSRDVVWSTCPASK
jgi:hypothetical protein